MKSLSFRLLPACAIGIACLTASAGHAQVQPGQCTGSGQTRFCFDAATRSWVASPSASATGFPDRAEVDYRGSFSMTVGSLGASKGKGRQLSGTMDITLEVTGSRVTARIGGTGLEWLALNGTVENGYCRLHSNAVDVTIVYEGQCGPQGFAGRTTGGSRLDGFSQDGQFDLSAVRLVDLGEQDRLAMAAQAERDRQAAADRAARDQQAAAEQAERNRQAAAAQAQQQQQAAATQAAYRALPVAGPVLTRRLEGWVHEDSLGWGFFKYDPGSVRDVKIVDGTVKSGNYVLEGDYTYNNVFSGWVTGWVKVAVRGNRFNCIEFWDTGGCRGLRAPLQGSGDVANGSAGSGTSNSDDWESQQQRANLQQSLIQSHAPVNQPGE